MKLNRNDIAHSISSVVKHYIPSASTTVHYSAQSNKHYLALNDNYIELPKEIIDDVGNLHSFLIKSFPEDFI
jgi:hypothetical protein